MEFDIVSFLAGIGGGAAGTIGVQQALKRRAAGSGDGEKPPKSQGSGVRIRGSASPITSDSGLSIASRVRDIRFSLGRAPIRRYVDELVPYLQQYHLPSTHFNLTDLLVEPRVLLDISDHDFDLEERASRVQSTSRVVPRIHDFPEIYSSYNLESMRLTEMLNGDRHIAVLGNPGMGKSTLLATLALMAVGSFEIHDLDELRPENMAQLNDKEVEKLEDDYKKLQAATHDIISEIRRAEIREEFGAAAANDFEFDVETTDYRRLLPILIHAGNIVVDMNLFGVQVDPSEPVIRAVQDYVSVLSGRVLPEMLYGQLEMGNCIILIDGYDELAVSERNRIYPWLQSFIEQYGHNRIVIAGPSTGYDPLIAAGFTPAFIAPVNEEETIELIKNWLRTWHEANGIAIKEDDSYSALVQKLVDDNRNRSIFELTLKIWSGLEGIDSSHRPDWLQFYVNLFGDDDEEYRDVVLREIAKVIIERGETLKSGQLVEIATARTEADETPMDDPEFFIRSLRDDGLLVRRENGSYDFRHPIVTAYLGGQSLIHDMNHRLEDVANEESWQDALGFAAAELDMSPAVRAKLSTEVDLLYSNLFSVTKWLRDSDPNAKWRVEIMKRLSAAVISNTQFEAVRQRAVSALVASGDPGVGFIFKQGVRHSSAIVRKLSTIGLGALGSTDAIRELRSMIVDDDLDVQLAAAQALAAIHSESALETLVEALLVGDETVRQAISTAFAAIPGEGYAILKDAVNHDDMLVRRASVYGLSRIPALWALQALYKVSVEEPQWYVKSAAQDVFSFMRDPSKQGPRDYIELEQLQWFRQFKGRMDDLPDDVDDEQILVHALQKGNTKVRELAAQRLAVHSHKIGVKPLYVALMDSEETVRAAAYNSLAELNQRATESLPGIT